MEDLSIGQFAALAGVNASTLRYYEAAGLLPPPERKYGQRRYDGKWLDRIHFIKIAQQTGFSLKEIALLLQTMDAGDAPSNSWREMAKRKRSELEERKKQIHTMIQILDDGINCECLTWSECLEKIRQTM